MAHVVDHLSVSALEQRYRSRAVLVAGQHTPPFGFCRVSAPVPSPKGLQR